jgi:hypothetical protein
MKKLSVLDFEPGTWYVCVGHREMHNTGYTGEYVLALASHKTAFRSPCIGVGLRIDTYDGYTSQGAYWYEEDRRFLFEELGEHEQT